jgi:hypothetical protein
MLRNHSFQILLLFAATAHVMSATDCLDPDNSYLCECQNTTNPLYTFEPGNGNCVLEEARRNKLRVGTNRISGDSPCVSVYLKILKHDSTFAVYMDSVFIVQNKAARAAALQVR